MKNDEMKIVSFSLFHLQTLAMNFHEHFEEFMLKLTRNLISLLSLLELTVAVNFIVELYRSFIEDEKI